MTTPRIYTAQEVAGILQINIRKVRENAKTRKWPSLDFGERSIRFTENHLDQILTKSEKQPPPAPSMRRRRRTT
jgi:hypothetical protein